MTGYPLAFDSGLATVVAAGLAAVPSTIAALVAAHRAKHVGRTADQARASAKAAAESVKPNGRGTVMELLETLDDKIDELTDLKIQEHQKLHERISALVTLVAHYLGPPPPGLNVPPASPAPPSPRRRGGRRRGDTQHDPHREE